MSVRDELLVAEEAGWHELWTRLHKLSSEDWLRSGATGDWTPKDVLAHIAAWHAEATRHLECLRVEGKEPRWPGVEEFNREAHERCSDMTLKEVQAMSGAARHRFREELALVEVFLLTANRAEAMANSAHVHYEEHVPLLDAFLGSA